MASVRSQRDTVQLWNVNTKRPDARIDRAKFDAVSEAILEAVPRQGSTITFKELPAAVEAILPGGAVPGGGSVTWYTTAVKLHLEHEGVIERVPGASPQVIRRVR